MRGGEKVLEALCRIFPEADIFTLFYNPEKISPTIRQHKITASFLDPLRKHHRSLLPLMPLALERFDLRDYDLVISSESGPAKGVLTPSTTRHICYCHTPMRYLWELYPAYINDYTQSSVKRFFIAPVANYMRLWDYATAARVDTFIANSANVQQRIWKTYRRESTVIHPPVAVETFYSKPAEDYHLIVSELVAYKRVDLAVQWANDTGRKLKIVGDGPEYTALKARARANTEFCGRVSDNDLRELYAKARAFLQPGEEDFGIASVEALASGKPVIALARGGAAEIVPEGGGVLYQEPGGLAEAIRQWERIENQLDPSALQTAAKSFSHANFDSAIRHLMLK